MFNHSHSNTDHHQRSIGVFPTYQATERALHELRDAGFPMDRVSVITQEHVHKDSIAGAEVHDPTHTERHGNKADEGATLGAVTGGTLGGLTGLLVGLGTLAIPGIGPVMLAGATATALATTLAGGAIGAVAGGLTGALIGLGIPEERAKVYNERVARGQYLVIVDGSDQDIAFAERILHRQGIEEYGVYHNPTPSTTTATTPAYLGTDTTIGRNKYAIAHFNQRHAAEAAIANLQAAGFPLRNTSLIARHVERPDRLSGIAVYDRFDAARLGVPVDRARYYNDRLDQGDYLVIVHGNDDDVARAATILRGQGIQDWQVYDPTLIDSTQTTPSTTVPSANPFALPTSGVQPTRQAVGAFSHRQAVEQAIAALQRAGFPLDRIFLMNHHFEQPMTMPGLNVRDRFDAIRFGIPAERAEYYNSRFKQGDYILMVRGSDDEINRAVDILNNRNTPDWQVHEPIPVRNAPRVESTPGVMTSPQPGTAQTVTPGRYRRAMGTFSHRRDAEAALTDLKQSGFPMERLSLIAKHADQHDQIAGVEMNRQATGNKADEGAKAGALTGATVGGLGGLLVGLGTLAIPGIGPVILSGAAATAIATALSGGAIGAAAGGLVGALVGLGIPENRAKVYNDRLNRGDYLVMVEGSDNDVRRAESVLKRHGIHEWDVFDANDVSPASAQSQSVHSDVVDTRSDRPITTSSSPDVVIIDRRHDMP